MQRDRDVYNLFGLGVTSELALPLPANRNPSGIDIDVIRGRVVAGGDCLFQTSDPISYACFRQDDAIILVWEGVRFRVVPGRVYVDAEDERMVAHLLVPAVWSVVLATAGQESLHGAAVSDGERALAILGESGSGKTTASRALIDRGWNLVSDDLLAFDDDLNVRPGPPWIRILEDDAAMETGEPDMGGKLRLYPPVSPEPVPLAAMIIMAPEYTRQVRLSGMAAASALFQQVYNAVLTHDGQVGRRFELVQRLADRIPVYGVPPRSLTVDQMTGLLEEMYV